MMERLKLILEREDVAEDVKKEIRKIIFAQEQMAEDLHLRQTELEMRNQELMRMHEESQKLLGAEKMKALGILAEGVAHELNNALGVIMGYSELILLSSDVDSRFKEGIAKILEGSRRAAAMVRDLLNISKRGITYKSIINLNDTVNNCKDSLEFNGQLLQHPNVKINIVCEPDLSNTLGSHVHFERMLMNLCLNAFESMPSGGDLTIKTMNKYLTEPICGYDRIREGDYVLLSVSDEGEGISKKDLVHIFEPFYVKKMRKRRYGTGLGLSVVWNTVQDQNGYIHIESEECNGTIVALYFPVAKESSLDEDISARLLDIRQRQT